MDDLLIFLKEAYGLDNPTIVKTISRGLSAFNYALKDSSGSYFLKTYNPKRARDQIEEMQRAELFFAAHEVPAIAPLFNKKGDTLSEHQGSYVALFPYITDRELDNLPNMKAVASMAEMSAQLHLATKGGHSLVLTRGQDHWQKESFLRDAQALMERIDAAAPSDFNDQAREFLQLKISLAKDTILRFEDLHLEYDAVLHGDYHCHNVFFDEQDQVSHIFDFERVRRGSRTTELAYGIFFNCFDLNMPVVDEVTETHFEKARTYVAAYRSMYPIEDEEIRRGIIWFYHNHSIHVLWPLSAHYIDNDPRADILVPKRTSRLKYFSENLDAILAVAVAK